MIYEWGHSRRFNALTNFFQRKFGERIQKLSINAGFTCPNRDGSKGRGGCIYCNNSAFNPSYCTSEKSISQQIDEGITFHEVRYRRAGKYLAYFQSFSNTYADIKILKEKFNEALQHPSIAGLVIGTRPDCIDDEKLGLLKSFSEKYFISVEYGVESCYNRTLKFINRRHDFGQSVQAIEATAKEGIHTGAHFIFGLPGESKDDMLAEAAFISKLPLSSVKFHQLQIINDTVLADLYMKDPSIVKIFNLEEYIEFIIDFCERLNPSIMIERFTAEVPPKFLVTGGFGLQRTDQILQKIEKRMEERDTWQGRYFKEK
jgi:uncharacterized protein